MCKTRQNYVIWCISLAFCSCPTFPVTGKVLAASVNSPVWQNTHTVTENIFSFSKFLLFSIPCVFLNENDSRKTWAKSWSQNLRWTCVHESKCTCAFEVSTEFEAFADAAFRVRGKSFLDVLHTYTARTIFTLPEQTIDEHLQREKLFNTLHENPTGVTNRIISNFYRCPTGLDAGLKTNS